MCLRTRAAWLISTKIYQIKESHIQPRPPLTHFAGTILSQMRPAPHPENLSLLYSPLSCVRLC